MKKHEVTFFLGILEFKGQVSYLLKIDNFSLRFDFDFILAAGTQAAGLRGKHCFFYLLSCVLILQFDFVI